MWLRNVQQATEGSVVMMSKLGMRHVSRQKRGGGGGGIYAGVFKARKCDTTEGKKGKKNDFV